MWPWWASSWLQWPVRPNIPVWPWWASSWLQWPVRPNHPVWPWWASSWLQWPVRPNHPVWDHSEHCHGYHCVHPLVVFSSRLIDHFTGERFHPDHPGTHTHTVGSIYTKWKPMWGWICFWCMYVALRREYVSYWNCYGLFTRYEI